LDPRINGEVLAFGLTPITQRQVIVFQCELHWFRLLMPNFFITDQIPNDYGSGEWRHQAVCVQGRSNTAYAWLVFSQLPKYLWATVC
jgi:hypothetical protein